MRHSSGNYWSFLRNWSSKCTLLQGLPSLPSLKRLEVSENRITGGLETLSACPNLTHLVLTGNKIADMQTIAPLAELKHLISLDLINCGVSNNENYRADVFKVRLLAV
uniref:Uncharacterized protein n=1 Tax=Parascaris equorum TaxID=6256 RepID=A0A914RBU9_PAREQ